MIAVLKPGASPERTQHLIHWLEEQNLGVHVSKGEYQTVLGLIGNTEKVDMEMIQSLDIVESVTRVSDPFKAVNRKFHPEDSVIQAGPASIGGGHFALIAGPCSVETEEQITFVAQEVKKAGAAFLRGGAFKPRTSPYDFQGLGEEGIRLLLEAKKATGLPIVTELMDIRNLDLFEEVDVIQVGARNTQNFDMLKELGKTNKPILLKRGLAGTIKELLMSAEYIMANGNENVILCERGIRTYESTYTPEHPWTCRWSPSSRALTHLPVVVDPSHGTGHAYLVEPMAMAAAAAGADGIMIEVHNDPPHALCDGAQSLTPEQFAQTAPEDLPDPGGDAGDDRRHHRLRPHRRVPGQGPSAGTPPSPSWGGTRDPSITEFAQIAQAIQGPPHRRAPGGAGPAPPGHLSRGGGGAHGAPGASAPVPHHGHRLRRHQGEGVPGGFPPGPAVWLPLPGGATPWRGPTSPASSTAGPTSLTGHPWCWCPPPLTK